jgi:hypothetical protein
MTGISARQAGRVRTCDAPDQRLEICILAHESRLGTILGCKPPGIPRMREPSRSSGRCRLLLRHGRLQRRIWIGPRNCGVDDKRQGVEFRFPKDSTS